MVDGTITISINFRIYSGNTKSRHFYSRIDSVSLQKSTNNIHRRAFYRGLNFHVSLVIISPLKDWYSDNVYFTHDMYSYLTAQGFLITTSSRYERII